MTLNLRVFFGFFIGEKSEKSGAFVDSFLNRLFLSRIGPLGSDSQVFGGVVFLLRLRHQIRFG